MLGYPFLTGPCETNSLPSAALGLSSSASFPLFCTYQKNILIKSTSKISFRFHSILLSSPELVVCVQERAADTEAVKGTGDTAVDGTAGKPCWRTLCIRVSPLWNSYLYMAEQDVTSVTVQMYLPSHSSLFSPQMKGVKSYFQRLAYVVFHIEDQDRNRS